MSGSASGAALLRGLSAGRGKGRRAVLLLLKLALTAVVTLFIVRRVGLDLSDLAAIDLGRFRPRALPLTGSVLLLGLGYVWSAALWGRMVREMGGPTLAPRVTVPLFMVANLGRYVPGKLLQIAGLTLLARVRGVRPAVAAGAAILGQGVALLGATLMGTAAFLSPDMPANVRLWGWIGLGAVSLFVVLTSHRGLARRLEAAWFRLARSAPPAEGADPVLKGRFGLRWTGLYLLNWGVYAGAFWLLFVGLEEWRPFLFVGPAFAAAYVGGYIAFFAPAGLGVREMLLVVFLAPTAGAEPALAVAAVARLWTTAVEVLPAALMAPGVLRVRTADAATGPHEEPERTERDDDGS